jgi:hypothetical protein
MSNLTSKHHEVSTNASLFSHPKKLSWKTEMPANKFPALLLFYIHCFFCLQVFVLFTVQENVPDKYFLVYTLLENMKRYFGSRTAENRVRSREKIWLASLKFSGK